MVLVILMLFTSNPVLSVAAVLVLPIFMVLLWREGEPPVLLFAVFYQWIQVSSNVFHADLLGLPLRNIALVATTEEAMWLGLVGLVTLTLGMHIVLARLNNTNDGISLESDNISLDRIFAVCLCTTLIVHFILRLVSIPITIRQIILPISSLRWVFIYALGYIVLQRRKKHHYYIIIFILEFVLGIGYFAGWTPIIFVSLIVLFTTSFPIKRKTIASVSLVVVTLFIVSLVWTSVKGEYRNYLNEGTRQQVVLHSRTDMLKKIGEFVTDLDTHDLQVAAEPLFQRLSYIDYFAKAIEYVPDYAPHERGSLWGASILHVLRPRVLFPNKPILPADSELTMRFTGEHMASDMEGTSISLGYMAESYIDFGRYGMFIPVFFIGILWGSMYYYFMTRKGIPLLAYGFTTTVLISAHLFETAGIKLLGGMLMKFIVMSLVFVILSPALTRLLTKNTKSVLVTK